MVKKCFNEMDILLYKLLIRRDSLKIAILPNSLLRLPQMENSL